MVDPIYPTFAILAIILVLIPAPWHYKARNSGTLIFIFWEVLANLVFMINGIVWAGNLRNPVPVWCDITTKLIVGFGTALPAASLCINRRLYQIATVRTVTTSKAHKRREILIDVAIGFGLPIIFMALHYVVQGHRFDIIEDIGCWPSTYNTAPGVVVLLVPGILISLVSFVYCTLSIIAFMKHRATFSAALANHNSNTSRYFRLMALASMEILFSLPMGIYHLVQNTRVAPLHPWISWEDTHFNFGRVDFIPRIFFNASPVLWIDLQIGRWLAPFGAFVFFIFFGLAPEARERYIEAYYIVMKPFGIVRPSATITSSLGSVSHPRFQISSVPISTHHSRSEKGIQIKVDTDKGQDFGTDSDSVSCRLSTDINVTIPPHAQP
jgi:pheromone a factor receptor